VENGTWEAFDAWPIRTKWRSCDSGGEDDIVGGQRCRLGFDDPTVAPFDTENACPETRGDQMVRGVLFEIGDEFVARWVVRVVVGHRQAWQPGMPLRRMKSQPIIMPAPRRPDLVCLFQHDDRLADLPQRGGAGETSGSSADDDRFRGCRAPRRESIGIDRAYA
jgi:hypothetical protein